MFNYVSGNPFGQKIESAVSTGQENKRRQENQQQDDEKNYLEDDDKDEVSISRRPELDEDQILYLVKEYIEKLKAEHSASEKIIQKLDKYLSKFDVKKFMKQNPKLTISEFNMVMFGETSDLLR